MIERLLTLLVFLASVVGAVGSIAFMLIELTYPFAFNGPHFIGCAVTLLLSGALFLIVRDDVSF